MISLLPSTLLQELPIRLFHPEVRGQECPLNQSLDVSLLGHREDFEEVKIKLEEQRENNHHSSEI